MDQLLLVYDDVSRRTDEGAVTDVVLFNFSKAFDVVVHELLIDKLISLNINGNLLKWIISFLTSRFMRVCVKGKSSSSRPVLSGVPQAGSYHSTFDGIIRGPQDNNGAVRHNRSQATCQQLPFLKILF